jgi:tol-pal system protein YbgF
MNPMDAMTRLPFSALIFGFFTLCAAQTALAQAQDDSPAAADSSHSALDTRFERLEEQMVDLQGVVAAVETLAKSGGGGSAAAGAPSSAYPAGGGAGGASGDQFRQLSEQIADLTQRLERLEARFGMNGPADGGASNHAALPQSPAGAASASEDSAVHSYSASPPPSASASASSGVGDFGTKIVPQNSTRSVEQAAAASPGSAFSSPSSAASAQGGGQPVKVAAVSSGAARTLYDQAYGALQRREYRAAETYFQEFMRQYANDALAPEAQFYFAESAYQSAEYRNAADRFLKAYSDYPASAKAPEALLKLAMSLRRLGEKSAACDSFAELARRYPQAPADVERRADTEKRRANCG